MSYKARCIGCGKYRVVVHEGEDGSQCRECTPTEAEISFRAALKMAATSPRYMELQEAFRHGKES